MPSFSSSFSFLHAADLHLDSPLRGLARRGEIAAAFLGASRRALENLVDAAIANEVAFLVVAGDIYDGDWRDYATGQFFVRQMGRLARAGIRVFAISGNHDAESVISKSLPLPANMHAFSVRAAETVTIEELRVKLHGRGFASRHVPDNVALAYPAAAPGYLNIGVLHTSLTGREGHDVYAPCSVEDLERAGYDYWALGHVHQRELIGARMPILFPGNLQGRHARETGPKGATLVTVTDGRIEKLEPLTLDAARFEHVVLDVSGIDAKAVLEKARAAIFAARDAADDRPLALRLTLQGETALHAHLSAAKIVEDMQAVAAEAGADVLIEKVRNATTGLRGAVLSAAIGFDEVLAAVAADPGFMQEIARTLADLRGKAPDKAIELLGDEIADVEHGAAAAIAEAQDAVRAALGEAATGPESEAEDRP
jgi:DNA repair exonuclease SbcCD nuclease subunit